MRKKAFQAAFPYTIPIFAGFWFLVLAYGIYMNANGFPFVYPMLMSLLIYGGSLEFVAVEMLLSPFAPMQVFIMTLLIQARHIFYGISMLDRFKGMGWKKFYLIFGMCDETFSVNYTADIPEDVDRGWFALLVWKNYIPTFFPIARKPFCTTSIGIMKGYIHFHTIRKSMTENKKMPLLKRIATSKWKE